MCYYSNAESRERPDKGGDAQETMKKITSKRVVEELAAIGFARATNFLCVSDGELTIRATDTLSKADQAAIASVERTSNGTLGNLSAIANEANSWGADLFVSVHFNAGGGDGWEGLVYGDDRVAMGRIYEKYVLAIGQNSRGVKLRPDLAVLRLTQMPAILNEGAFVDNRKDIADWDEDAELQKLAQAYALATAEVLGLQKKAADTLYRVQVGAFREAANAETLKQKLQSAGYDVFVVTTQK